MAKVIRKSQLFCPKPLKAIFEIYTLTMPFFLKRTNSIDLNFIELVRLLDAELAKINGNEDVFYAQFNKIDKIKHVVLVYDEITPVACGVIKQFSASAM